MNKHSKILYNFVTSKKNKTMAKKTIYKMSGGSDIYKDKKNGDYSMVGRRVTGKDTTYTSEKQKGNMVKSVSVSNSDKSKKATYKKLQSKYNKLSK